MSEWLMIGVLGAVGTLLYKIWNKVWAWIKNQCSLEIQVRTWETRAWVNEFIAELVYSNNAYRTVEVIEDPFQEENGYQRTVGRLRGTVNEKNISRAAKLASKAMFVLGKGTHTIFYRGRPILVTKGTEGEMDPADFLVLRAWGRDIKFLKDFVLDAEAAYKERRASGISIFNHNGKGAWYEVAVHRGRPLASVVLKDNQSDVIACDVQAFLDSADYYSHMDIPYRRGYLLYGPPGCGKSSLVKALATEFGMDLYVMAMGATGLTDDAVHLAMSVVPPGSVVLLEDIDAAFVQRKASNAASGITFSGLLNAIDGVTAAENRVLIMTTNYIDRLDPALIRSGRVDVQYELSLADEDMAARMFLRFYPESSLSQVFGTKARGSSPADIQAHLLKHINNPDGAYQAWP